MRTSTLVFFIGLAVAFGGAVLNSAVSDIEGYQNSGIPLIIVGLFIACLGFGASAVGNDNKESKDNAPKSRKD